MSRGIGKTSVHKVAYIIAILFFFYLIFKSLAGSLYFKRDDRINFFIFDENPTYYSFSQNNTESYQISFPPDLKVQVPGGYSYYRFGALGKLVSLEKKPSLLGRTASTMTSTLTHFYFYSGGDSVYYGSKAITRTGEVFKILSYRSNAGFFDRIYLFFTLLTRKGNIAHLSYSPKSDKGQDKLDTREFSKKYQGYLYQKTYREENKNVQIIYTKSYSSALNIGNILEGNGIRVADISSDDNEKILKDKCYLIENEDKFSHTARSLAEFFGCSLKKDKTGTYDIILMLGEKEGDWVIN